MTLSTTISTEPCVETVWILTLFFLLALIGCSEGLLEPDREARLLQVELSDSTVIEGGEVAVVDLTVLDEVGQPFDPLPSWLEDQPVLSSSSEQIVKAEGDVFVAEGPGEATVQVDVAGLTGFNTVRVNPRELTLTIDGAYIVQSVQRPDGSVPLIAGRDGVLRVFVRGDQPSFYKQMIRARLLHHGQPVETIEADLDRIPTLTEEGDLATSWNVEIDGEWIQPGLSLLVEVVPVEDVPITAESQRLFPADGRPQSLEVRQVPPVQVRLVPIYDRAINRGGDVDVSSAPDYVADFLAMFPVAEHEIDVRTSYSTRIGTYSRDNLSRVIREIRTLQRVEDSDWYYYGVFPSGQNPEVGGLGYLPGKASIGVSKPKDEPGQGYFTRVFAHELGHNFGRYHAPCGDPGGIDEDYPYSQAGIGVFGLDVSTMSLKSPSTQVDLMSYCDPEWISDYTYTGVVEHLVAQSQEIKRISNDTQKEVLLVWGSVGPEKSVLEPAFEITAPVHIPSNTGPYVLDGRDDSGTRLFSYRFQGTPLAHGPEGQRDFTFTLPRARLSMDRLAEIRISGPGVDLAVQQPAAHAKAGALVAPPWSLQRSERSEALLEWSSSAYPMALVRSRETGEILSFARDGAISFIPASSEVDLYFSDGVRTVKAQASIR